MKEYLPLLAALATAPACNGGSIKLEDTSVEPADIQIEEGDTDQEANVLAAGEDGQDMGCVSLTTAVSAQIGSVFVMNQGYSEEDGGWTDNPAGFFGDRSASLNVNDQEVATVNPAGSDGALRFDMTSAPAELEAGTDYDICIVGNPGATTGEFAYIAYQDGVVASTNVGSETDPFPLQFAPSFIVE